MYLGTQKPTQAPRPPPKLANVPTKIDSDRALVGEDESDSDESDESSDEDGLTTDNHFISKCRHCSHIWGLLAGHLARFQQKIDEQAQQISDLQNQQKATASELSKLRQQRTDEINLAKRQAQQNNNRPSPVISIAPATKDKPNTQTATETTAPQHKPKTTSTTPTTAIEGDHTPTGNTEESWATVAKKKITAHTKKLAEINRFKAQVEKQDNQERDRVLDRLISGRSAKPGYRRLTSLFVKGITRQSVNQVQKILVMMGLDTKNFITMHFHENNVCEMILYEDAEEQYKEILQQHKHLEVVHNANPLHTDDPANQPKAAKTRKAYLESWRDSLPPARFFNLARAYLNFNIRKLSIDE
ncbi:hypothetical protein SeMB42_g03595 [Synchytrium endobioticum]|uniref:Uncharacterized protein n=1 Tax=Synchytrium endobioticum TaxID=286115 RepID=A0A507D618_9FUNG|nr:hypothetical protein SeMB42_g03595 [Synchytrium endobioticum]